MADVKWIKLVTDVFDNRKVRQIESMPEGDSILVVWFKILCLAGSINDSGMIYFTKDIPFTDEMLAIQFNKSLMIIKLALETFKQFKMIEIVDNILLISSWEKYQNIERLDIIREQTRKRVAKYREKQHQITHQSVTSNDNVTQSNAPRTRKENKKEDLKDIKSGVNTTTTHKRFVKPNIEEITKYCKERNNNIDPVTFFDKNESTGWVVGKTCKPMKDWKAVIRTWENNNKNSNSGFKTKQQVMDDKKSEQIKKFKEKVNVDANRK